MFQYHRYANIFPVMSDDEISALAEDIRLHGQHNPVILDEDGLVLDGRNRLAACEIAGVTACIEHLRTLSAEQKLNLVMSLNMTRRHLNESQRAMAAARMAEALQALQAFRNSAPAADPEPDGQAEEAYSGEGIKPRAKRPREVAAERMSVSPRSVQDAATVLGSGRSEVVDAVDRGETAVSAAARQLRLDSLAAVTSEQQPQEDRGSVMPVRMSRQERDGIKRDVVEIIRSHGPPRRAEVAEWIVAVCQKFLG